MEKSRRMKMPEEEFARAGETLLGDVVAIGALLLFECRSIPLNLFMPASCASRRCSHLDSTPAVRPERREAGYMIIKAVVLPH